MSSLATNSNAALSFSATQLAALLIAPQRPPSFFSGSLVASALTFAWPWEILPLVAAGALLRLALDLAGVLVHLALGVAQAGLELGLDLADRALELAA